MHFSQILSVPTHLPSFGLFIFNNFFLQTVHLIQLLQNQLSFGIEVNLGFRQWICTL